MTLQLAQALVLGPLSSQPIVRERFARLTIAGVVVREFAAGAGADRGIRRAARRGRALRGAVARRRRRRATHALLEHESRLPQVHECPARGALRDGRRERVAARALRKVKSLGRRVHEYSR